MGVHVVGLFRPKPGGEAQLAEVTADHLPILRSLGFATERPSLVLRGSDGTILEHFEWVDAAAIDAAHEHPEVHRLWARYEACCDYVTLGDLAEAGAMFPSFEYVGSY